MRRRACGRDLTLSGRMVITGLLLLGLYGVALVPPLWLMWQGWLDAKWALGWDAGVLLLLWLQYRSLDSLALRASRAALVGTDEAPELHRALEKLASLADIPKPCAAIVWSDVPDAFATGRNPERSTVAITRGLVSTLEPEELEAVLAPELSHVANRDGALQKIAGRIAEIPSADLRQVASMSAFFIVPTNLRALTHPPLEKRLARLAEMSRELGKPVPPASDLEAKAGNALTVLVSFVLAF